MNPDIYGRSVDFSTDGIVDVYRVGGAIPFEYAAGTDQAVAYLAFAKQGKLVQFQAALQDFLLSRYTLETRWSFIALYVTAQSNILLVNRRAYIGQLFTWASSVITLAATMGAAINAAGSEAAAAAITWDFSTLVNSDPLVSPLAAAAINN